MPQLKDMLIGLHKLDIEVAELERDLEKAKEVRAVAELDAFNVMVDEGVARIDIEDIGPHKPDQTTYAKWLTDDFDKRAKALNDAGEGDLVKRTPQINHQTMSARVREWIGENGDGIPEELDGILTKSSVPKIKRPAVKL